MVATIGTLCFNFLAWESRAQDLPPKKPMVMVGADKLYGPKSNGLQAKLALSKSKFAVGETIRLSYTKRNVSPDDLTIWHSGFWPNHRVIVRKQAGEEPELLSLGMSGQEKFTPTGPRKKNFPVTLKPSEEDSSEGGFDLIELYDLSEPGSYQVWILYEEATGITGWQGRLQSNRVAFEVK